jgi:hypothetical protein
MSGATDDAATIAERLGGQRSGNGWLCLCPAHGDKNPSLSVGLSDDGRLLFHCHSGCSQEEVIQALRDRGLWPEKLGDREQPPTGGRHPPPGSTAEKQLGHKEQEQFRAVAQGRALRIWKYATPAKEHPYLTAKGIKAHGLRIYKGCLLVPAYDGDGTLHSLQFIDNKGEKRFLSGGAIAGHFFILGEPRRVILLAEGYATAATLFEATGHAVVVAFNAGNLKAVAEVIRRKFPHAQFLFCADDDHLTRGNPGITKAREAAQAVGGLVTVPRFRA